MDNLNRESYWTPEEMKQAMQEVMDGLIADGMNVVYICVYGSQNYELDMHNKEYQSDLDMKAVVVPTLDDLVLNHKQVTLTKDTKYGQVDVKDIRLFTNNVKKANPAYIECLFTPYFLFAENSSAHHMMFMRLHAESLCKAQSAQMSRAMFGMMKEKQKALCHPYPSIKHKIDKWGYDGKQLSHAIRLHIMLQRWIDGNHMETCLIPTETEKKILIDTKLNKLTLENAKELMDSTVDGAKIMLDKYLAELEKVPMIELNPDNILVEFEKFKSNTIKHAIIDKIEANTLDWVMNVLAEQKGNGRIND